MKVNGALNMAQRVIGREKIPAWPKLQIRLHAKGIVAQIDRIYRQVTLQTPVNSVKYVDTIRIGDVTVDPETFEDRLLTRG